MAISFEESLKAARTGSTAGITEDYGITTADVGIDTLAYGSVIEDIPAYDDGTTVEPEQWTLSSDYLYYADYSDDDYSTVDESKNIVLSSSQINITQEKNSQFIPFKIPKKYDGFDLSTTRIQIFYINADGGSNYATPINVYYGADGNDYIKFGWLVDEYVTATAGDIKFEIHATGTNSKGQQYIWKTKPSTGLKVLQSLSTGGVIEPDQSWITDFLTLVSEKVSEAQAEVVKATEQADASAASAAAAAESAAIAQDAVASAQATLEAAVDNKVKTEMNAALENYYPKDEADSVTDSKITEALTNHYTKTEADEASAAQIAEALKDHYTKDEADIATNDQIDRALENHYEKSEIDTMFEDFDISDQLEGVKQDITDLETNLGKEIDDVKNTVDNMDGLAAFGVEYSEPKLTFYNGETVMGEVEISSDPTDEWVEEYSKGVDEKISVAVSNVQVDLTGYATEKFVTDITDGIADNVSTNTSSITSLNKSVADINQALSEIDGSPRLSYEATYGEVEMDDGSTAEYMFTLWETEGEGDPVVKSRFQIMGGGGTSSGVVMRIAYLEGYTTPVVATVDDKVLIRYSFTGEDPAGDTNLDGVASWKIGNRVVATQDVSTGECEFDLTEYVTTGDNKVALTITHATGAVATKAWTVKIIDVRLESSFDDTKKNPANQPVLFTFTPYGGIAKTVHFLLDGEEIATKESSAAAAGLSDSYSIPAQSHSTHLFEIYMTAEVNGKTIESNHIVKDIIWYDETSDVPLIACAQQEFTARQYEATNIVYTIYDPSTENPTATLTSTYVGEDGEDIEDYNSTVTMSANTATWQYKTDVLGEHTLTIACDETVKILKATVTDLGINVTPITTGLVFDFNPVGYSNGDANRLWSSGDIAMTVSDNFDWVNGGYQIDENGDQCFCIKAGTSAEINYELFGDDAKTSGKHMKLIFKTENVADGETVFMSCLSNTTGSDNIGIEMKAHEATIYAMAGEGLPLPYGEEEIIEFEFDITPSDQSPSMIMGYEDGVSTRPLVYDSTHNLQQYQGYRKTISLGSDDCDLYIYRFKAYNTTLSDRDTLNNFIADARSAEEMIARYDRNQIYKEGILDPDYLAEVCPDLRIIKLDVPWFTNDKDDKVYDASRPATAECIYKGGDPIYDNWVAYDVVHSGQGTSSNNYGPAGRNLDIIMKPYKDYGNAPYIILGDGSRVSKVSLTRESIPTNYFNVKVNIASSENANNAILAKRYNRYNPYKRPFVREDESIIPYIKDTMEFQNCVIFVKETDPDISKHREFADCNYHFYAIGNIGDSKKTDSSRLTDPDDPYECILEVMDNTLPNSTMPTGKVDENGTPIYPIDPSEWVAGNSAYDSLHSDTFDEAKADPTTGKLADTYGWRYIYEDGTDEQNAEAKAYVEGKWKEFYEFVVTSTDEEFKAHLGDYCVLDSVMYYYLFMLRYTMTDNAAKNSFYHYGKTGEFDSEGNPIRKWDLCFDYDND